MLDKDFVITQLRCSHTCFIYLYILERIYQAKGKLSRVAPTCRTWQLSWIITHKAWLNELSMSVRWSGRGSPELGLRIALTNGAPGPWPFTCTECSQKPVRALTNDLSKMLETYI